MGFTRIVTGLSETTTSPSSVRSWACQQWIQTIRLKQRDGPDREKALSRTRNQTTRCSHNRNRVACLLSKSTEISITTSASEQTARQICLLPNPRDPRQSARFQELLDLPSSSARKTSRYAFCPIRTSNSLQLTTVPVPSFHQDDHLAPSSDKTLPHSSHGSTQWKAFSLLGLLLDRILHTLGDDVEWSAGISKLIREPWFFDRLSRPVDYHSNLVVLCEAQTEHALRELVDLVMFKPTTGLGVICILSRRIKNH